MKEEYLKIINHYGLRNQLKKLSEEVYEFQEAVLLDDNGEESLENILEEFADIQVILEQFRYFYELDNTKVAEKEVFKAMRTLERIKYANDRNKEI